MLAKLRTRPEPGLPWTPVLMYHRVVQRLAADDPYHLCVSVDTFEEQMRYLRDNHYCAVGVADLPALLAKEHLSQTKDHVPQKYVAITFDDGYLDMYQNAFPILQKYDLAATVFCVSGCLGASNSWDAGKAPQTPLLSPEHLRELVRQRITIGSHSMTHRPLNQLSLDEAQVEIERSKAVLEYMLDVPVRCFAYPYGRSLPPHWEMAEDLGYAVACGISQRVHAPYNISRIDAARYPGTGLRWLRALSGLEFHTRSNAFLRSLRRVATPSSNRASSSRRVA